MAKNIASRDINAEILLVWDLSTPQEALEQFKKMLKDLPEDIEGLEGMNSKTTLDEIYRGQILTHVARAQGLSSDFDAAHASLSEAEAIVKDTLPASMDNITVKDEFTALKARIELERGRLFNSSRDAASATTHFMKALHISLSCSPDDEANPSSIECSIETCLSEGLRRVMADTTNLQYLVVDSLHMLAIAHESKERRAAFAQTGLEIAGNENAGPAVREWLGPLLSNAGWDSLENGDFEQAISLFQRAVGARKEAMENFDRKEGLPEDAQQKLMNKRVTTWKIARWSVGRALMEAGKEDEAVSTLEGILGDGLDGPAIRADLASLTAKRNEDSAVEHAQRAISLGVSKEKAKEMEAMITQFRA